MTMEDEKNQMWIAAFEKRSLSSSSESSEPISPCFPDSSTDEQLLAFCFPNLRPSAIDLDQRRKASSEIWGIWQGEDMVTGLEEDWPSDSTPEWINNIATRPNVRDVSQISMGNLNATSQYQFSQQGVAENEWLGQTTYDDFCFSPASGLQLRMEDIEISNTAREILSLDQVQCPPMVSSAEGPLQPSFVQSQALDVAKVPAPSTRPAQRSGSQKRKSSTVDGAGCPSFKSYGMAPTKKRAHNAIERKYRNNLTKKIAMLRDSVPSLCVMVEEGSRSDGNELESSGKHGKGIVLERATEYIRQLQNENKQLGEDHRRLELQFDRFRRLAIMSDMMNPGGGGYLGDTS